ncbi:MAG TPA: DUF1549 and DUF1553 domain-containing protein [Blastocatellia bacterium]|jgi:hypothetical protein|nr:DUF1549 and DUF1553 domain-containing protein [Blastocatellia bacterium]
MRPKAISKTSLIALWIAILVWLGADSLQAQKQAPGKNKFPGEHTDEKLNPARPDKQVSELTSSVAEKLPRAGAGEQRLAIQNLIDEHLFGAMAKDGVPHAPLASDYEFCRRVYLDLTGRIPTTDRLKAFVGDTDPNKRDKLIDELIDSQAWVDHWSYWYGDLVRNCGNRIGNPTLKHFDAWIRQSFKEDKPYDRFVTEMLTVSAPNTNWMPDAAASGFLTRWHVTGATMYDDNYEDTADEIIVNSARIFLGVNYQCISCHGGKGFLEKVSLDLTSKKRRDFWAMAAFFGKTRIRVVTYQDRYTVTEDGTGYDTKGWSQVRLQREGGEVQPTFILTGEKADLRKSLRPQFARMLTTHPQFARATVNLIWKQFFGLGIVDPIDSFDLARQDPKTTLPAPWTCQPTNTDLLDALAQDFAAHRFSLKRLMRTIARSSAYQLSSRFDGEWKESYTPYFARHYVRQLTAEQLHDAISQATQVFGNYNRRDYVYDVPIAPARFWTEAASPEDINNGEAKNFLRTFGQANREQFDRQSVGSILQAMTLMNSPFVTKRVMAANGSMVDQLVKSAKTSAEIVDDLYLATLSRYPLPAERQLALSWIEQDRRQGAEDLHWSLLNKLDFVFNY